MGKAAMRVRRGPALQALVLTILLGCGLARSSASIKCVRITDSLVKITGVVATEFEYGPPNYGEDTATDAHYHILVLRPDTTFAICGDPQDLPEIPAGTDSLSRVTVLQLQLGDLTTADTGRHVTVYGQLHGRSIGPEFFPIVMVVDSSRSVLSPR